MKHKNINSMLHNFGHSFCSLMNLFDDVCIYEVIAAKLKEIPNGVFKSHFPSGQIEPPIEVPKSLRNSVRYYADQWLPQHIKSHQLESEKITNIALTFTAGMQAPDQFQSGFECDVSCDDDKGTSHKVRVNQKVG